MWKWVPFGSVPELDARALARALAAKDPPFVLDVRTTVEFAQSHIEGARNIPITELAGRASELDGLEARVVVAICLSAHRSIPAVRLLRERGFRDVRQLAGGMLAWWARGLPTHKR